ncbi:MAG: M48 family metallopeptidase, partial [Planctomycetes bacterium]|nr:M48 family metallopeptidase [Planctomycetota bacterium]
MSYGYNDDQYRRNRGPGFGLGARMVPLLIGLVVVGITMARGCQQGPFGRAQVVAIDARQEAQLGVQAFQEVLSDSNVVKRGEVVDAVNEITSRLIEATQNPEFQKRIGIKISEFDWDVRVVHENQVNAFCLPGGKMVVYTAILPVAESDAGLATVMGHEISHALAHHGAERMAHSKMANIGLTAAGASMGDMSASQRESILTVLNAGAKFGILGYSRSHESEADHMGLLLMAAAGY